MRMHMVYHVVVQGPTATPRARLAALRLSTVSTYYTLDLPVPVLNYTLQLYWYATYSAWRVVLYSSKFTYSSGAVWAR